MEITLRNEDEFHKNHLVLGTAGLGGIWGNIDKSESVYSLEYALDNGVNVVDTAPAYNMAQEVLAEALRNRKNKLPIISSKVGRLGGKNADSGNYDYSRGAMNQSVIDTLNLLKIDSLDILFLHDPDAITSIDQLDRIMDTLIQIREKGYAKKIGLGGNFKNSKFYNYLRKDYLEVFQGYNKLNALTLDAMNEEFAHCIENEVMTYAASPLFNGLLGGKLDLYVKDKPEWIDQRIVNKAKEFQKICAGWGEDTANIAHQFLFSISEVDRVVIGARNLAQLKNTLETWQKGPLDYSTFQQVKNFAENK